jgi:hypothetical protein
MSEEILIGDAARILGITTDWLAQLADRGDIPCRRHPVSRNRIFKRADVEAYGRGRPEPGTDFLAPDLRPTVLLNLPPHVDPDEVLFGRRP